MKKLKIKTSRFYALLSIIFGLTAFLIFLSYIQYLKSLIPDGQLVEIAYAVKDIAPYFVISEDMIILKKMPRNFVHPESVVGKDKIIGMTTTYPIFKDEPIISKKILTSPDQQGLSYFIPEGMRIVSVIVDEASSLGGQLKPGDNVDVLASLGNETSGFSTTKIILERKEVVAVSWVQESAVKSNEKGQNLIQPNQMQNQSNQIASTNTVGLMVSPKEAEEITSAQVNGKITLILCPLKEEFDEKNTSFYFWRNPCRS